MNAAGRTERTHIRLIAAVVIATVCPLGAAPPAPAQEHLIHGFERGEGLRASGKVALVRGADVVTEGQSALELASDASITLTIPAKVTDQVGWLKIDSFEVQPTLASLRVTVGGTSRQGYVQPGRDTLAFPLGLVAGTDRGAWPDKPTRLEIRNTGRQPVVVDNLRVAAPPAAPAGAVLLDFGPAGKALWPGFEHAESVGTAITWSGRQKIYAYSPPYPDPLLGSFAGPLPSWKSQDVLNLQSPEGATTAWVWLTHYGTLYSPVLEYLASLNGKTILQHRLSPAQMLSAEGLLAGKDQPWTVEWFEESFIPRVVSKLVLPLREGENALDLANCQVAALVIAPRAAQAQTREYVQQLEGELKRYHRQFVLARQDRAQCDLAPSEEQTKAGVMVFVPPRDQWFNRTHTPQIEPGGGSIKLAAESGGKATAGLAAVPIEDGAMLQAVVETLREPSGAVVPPSAARVFALEALPAVDDAAVFYQPFLPARHFRNVRARGVYWFLVQVSVPQRARSGSYAGELRITTGKLPLRVPVELEVVQMPPAVAAGPPGTCGVLDTGSPYSVYRSLANVLPKPQLEKTSREILSALFSGDLNAAMVHGPVFSSVPTPQPDVMIADLRMLPRSSAAGMVQVNLETALRTLEATQVRPGTSLYKQAVAAIVQSSNALAAQAGLKRFALFLGYAGTPASLEDLSGAAAAVRAAGGKPAVGTYVSVLQAISASSRTALFNAADTLILTPNVAGLAALRDEFIRTGSDRTVAVGTHYADTFTCGLYRWSVGAEGVYVRQIFSYYPIFNAFDFNGLSLLVPNAQGGFEPTVNLLQLAQGLSDDQLARRCELLVKEAKGRRLDTQGLEKVLTEVRLTAAAAVPSFSLSNWRDSAVGEERLHQWRSALVAEARKLTEQIGR